MLGAAIVPESNRMRRPAKAHAPVRTRDVIAEEFEHAAAFARRHFVNVAGELAVDEQRLAATFGMADDDRMHRDRIGVGGLVEAAGAVMSRGLAREIVLHRRAE